MNMLDLNEDIHSLSDFKRRTSELVEQMEETGRPVVLTVNGKAKLVVQDTESYQKLLDSLEDAKTLRALASARSGKGRPAHEVLEELRAILKLPANTKKPKR